MKKFIKKNPMLSVIACILAAVLAVGLVSNLTGKVVTPLSYIEGDLDAAGAHVAATDAIFTEKVIDCTGLTITPANKFDGTYRVVFYGKDGNYIGTTGEMDKAYSVAATDIAESGKFSGATSCRIVITPNDADGIITAAEQLAYASYIQISYSK